MTSSSDLALLALLGAGAGFALQGTARAAVGGAAAGLGAAVVLGAAATVATTARAPSPLSAAAENWIADRFADLGSPAGAPDGFNQGPGF